MVLRRLASFGLSALLLFGMVLPAGPALAGAAPTGPLAQVIEGAKKEGTVSVKLHSAFTQKSMYRLEKEIKDKFGADLKINFSPVIQFPKALAEVIMEDKTGAVPSVDLLTLSGDIPLGIKAGVLEPVDWKPLLVEGTNPNVVFEGPLTRGGIVYYTGHVGLLYHPQKIKADEVPRTLADLAHPRWKGIGGLHNNINFFLRWGFVLGKEKAFSAHRAILKNGAIQGAYPDLLNRYLLGEVSWITITSSFLKDAQDKGMPAAWQSLDFSDISDFGAVVIKRASHPNAAKLVALYLASPAGAKFSLEEARLGTLYYPSNYEHDIRERDQRQGIPAVFNLRRPEILEFYNSKEAAQWEKEIRLIQQTGGER